MILMPQIFDVTANENARYKRNELEYLLMLCPHLIYTAVNIPNSKSFFTLMYNLIGQLYVMHLYIT